MTSAPLVSVLLTAYNREKYLVQAIESVLASTYENFELIIVDDGSTDQTVQIARKYQLLDSRVQVYVNKQQLGDYPNRNKAAFYASGKYLKYVDSDDYIYPHGLQVMVDIMERHPSAAFGICTEPKAFAGSPMPVELTSKEAFAHHYLGTGLFYRSPVDVIIRREVFLRANGFLALRMVSDLELWLRIAQKNNVLLLPDGLVWIRQHADREWQHHKRYLLLYEKIKLHYLRSDHGLLTDGVVKKVLRERKKNLFAQMIFSLIKGQFKRSLEHGRLLQLYLLQYRFYFSSGKPVALPSAFQH